MPLSADIRGPYILHGLHASAATILVEENHNQMGTLVGHVAPGFGFLIIGLWHLFNTNKNKALHPDSYISLPWFPSKLVRHLELYAIMLGSSISIAMELFIGPEKHQPFDDDGTIPSYHLQNFEHSSISLFLFIYAFFTFLFDAFKIKVHPGLAELLAGLTFSQQLLIFHLHSADHMGVEGQYHWLLQMVILVTLVTTLLGLAYPRSFWVAFVRAFSILFQGVWFIVMGFMLWIPEFVPKGCRLNMENGHLVVRCMDEKALHRAKALVNIQFSWYLAGVTVMTLIFYVIMMKMYGVDDEYRRVGSEEEDEDRLKKFDSFLDVGKGITAIQLER
ncbi:uncharacterized protein LOC116258718 [Nymphaea colorata]|uniref:Uncharacterized protein n=1 Tax=Nymphaea colorata TaxID=210225 RepID=A0A5K1FVU7_9MAGN|nr:uncharacterized protein LOC116258718 [Nymphaea colorata]